LWQLRIRQSAKTNLREKFGKKKLKADAHYVKNTKKLFGHLTSGYPILTKNEYVIRHDRIYTHVQYSICKRLGIKATENWYCHLPKAVCQHEDITVLWNQGVQTYREVLENRPDIIIKNMKDKICLLIDAAVPSDGNVIQESEKKLKYKNLSIEIQRKWNMKGFFIPVIIGAAGIVARGLKNICKQYQEIIQ
jgi:hypothetical protein